MVLMTMPTLKPRSIAFVSLGCPKNTIDSEQMLGTLTEAGFELVDAEANADAVIINTCGFLEASKQESLDVINQAIERKKEGKIQRVVVTGCLVQRHRARLLEWAPDIDALLGVFDRDHILEAVTAPDTERETLTEQEPPYWIACNALQAAKARGMSTVGLTVHGKDGKGIGYFEDESQRRRLTPRHWAYLRISEGCNQGCAFCTIPSIRGKMRSKPLNRIADEARRLMQDGAFELNLIGQDTTSYGMDIGYDNLDHPQAEGLIGLLRTLDEVATEFGGGWMRLMYAYPSFFTDSMIDAIAHFPNIVKYIDIPLQHSTDSMLTAMRRRISADDQLTLMNKLRERIDGLAIRTTLITGFPGETEADHESLCDFVREFQFDMLGVFKYSREPGTPAGTMDLDPKLHVPDEIKEAREAELMLIQQEIAFENAEFLAQEECQFDVLIDTPSQAIELDGQKAAADPQFMSTGRCYHQAPQVDSSTCVLSREELPAGSLVRATIVGSDGYDLIARPTDDLSPDIALPLLS